MTIENGNSSRTEVNFLGNGTQAQVPLATNIDKYIPGIRDNNGVEIEGGSDFFTVLLML
jgi:hypothetical protein